MSGAPIATGNEFVVNVLFYNTLQVFPMATLAGNTLDGPGFSIGKVLMSSNLFFSLNKQRFTCPIPDNQWTYLVMNVHPDHIDIYENGIFYATQKLKEPIGNSRYPIVVGNIYDNGNAHFYIGAIAEVSIGRNIVDSNQIKATWREIDNVVNKH